MKTKQGFTLVELIVALGLFTLVTFMGISAILVIINANRTSQALNEIMNNLNISLETMSRDIRVGSRYYCGNVGYHTYNVQDCTLSAGGKSAIYFKPGSGFPTEAGEYELQADGGIHEVVNRTIPGVGAYYAPGLITSPDVFIKNLTFYVYNSDDTNSITQPYVVIVVQGCVKNGDADCNGTKSIAFNIQTTVSQRIVN